MPAKPNYNFQKAERDRAKQAKKAEKAAHKKEQSARQAQGQPDEVKDAPAQDTDA